MSNKKTAMSARYLLRIIVCALLYLFSVNVVSLEAGTIIYSYDIQHRLAGADYNNQATAAYEYDKSGNITRYKAVYDADTDDLPDSWEVANFGNLSQCPGDDPDSDGLSNDDEFAWAADPNNPDTDGDGQKDGAEITAGTDPVISTSVFKATEIKKNVANPEYLDITWITVNGKTYKVHYSNDPYSDTMPWHEVPGAFIGDGSPITWTDDGAHTGIPPGDPNVKHRYYKVEVLP